ncbi:LLM class flavin-dependent oxidoreductase [Mycobacterium sp. BMJ-28]
MTRATNDGQNEVRLGIVFRPQIGPEHLAAAARAADQAGLDELWLWEDCFLAGGISSAAIALSHSAKLTVGVGVLPIPMRNVAVTAMEIATLARAFPGRVRIGVGHGVQDWMAQIGERVDSPMTLLREYLTCLTALLRGERVSFSGRYVQLDDVALDWPPISDTEVLAAATGPKTLRLSGELASGTVITGGTTPEALRAAVTQIGAGRDLRPAPVPHAVVAYVLCATGTTAHEELSAEIAHWGLDPAEDVGIAGDAGVVAAGVARWVRAGADTVVLQPSAGTDVAEFARFVGQDVAAAVRQR